MVGDTGQFGCANKRARVPGVDIVQEKRAARQEAKAAKIELSLPTFEECAEIYIREHWSTWSIKHRNQWPSSLKRYAYATIGKLTISEIKPSHIYELLRPIWVEKRETANRVRGRIETIIAKNVNVDDTDFRNPAELTKQLREKLPRRPKRVVRHHPALPYAEPPQFIADLSAAGGMAASMLRFLIFTACRTNEVVAVTCRKCQTAAESSCLSGVRHQSRVVYSFVTACRASKSAPRSQIFDYMMIIIEWWTYSRTRVWSKNGRGYWIYPKV